VSWHERGTRAASSEIANQPATTHIQTDSFSAAYFLHCTHCRALQLAHLIFIPNYVLISQTNVRGLYCTYTGHCQKANPYEEPSSLGVGGAEHTNIPMLAMLTFATFIRMTTVLAELRSIISPFQDHGSDPSPIGNCTAV
jgi:hypothetical protein